MKETKLAFKSMHFLIYKGSFWMTDSVYVACVSVCVHVHVC